MAGTPTPPRCLPAPSRSTPPGWPDLHGHDRADTAVAAGLGGRCFDHAPERPVRIHDRLPIDQVVEAIVGIIGRHPDERILVIDGEDPPVEYVLENVVREQRKAR